MDSLFWPYVLTVGPLVLAAADAISASRPGAGKRGEIAFSRASLLN
jgi:hypothetical protein